MENYKLRITSRPKKYLPNNGNLLSSVTSNSSLKLGFTLLETIVALAVILAAAVGPVSLVTSGIGDFAFSKNKIIAINLAQEGVELARAIRDNNVICDTLNGPPNWPWNEDPQGGRFTNITAGISVDRTVTINCGGVPGAAVVMPILSLSCIDKLRFDTTEGIYGYTGPQETIFSRCVQIKTPPDGPELNIPASDQMDIISTVTWQERGRDRTMTIKERLFNWR